MTPERRAVLDKVWAALSEDILRKLSRGARQVEASWAPPLPFMPSAAVAPANFSHERFTFERQFNDTGWRVVCEDVVVAQGEGRL